MLIKANVYNNALLDLLILINKREFVNLVKKDVLIVKAKDAYNVTNLMDIHLLILMEKKVAKKNNATPLVKLAYLEILNRVFLVNMDFLCFKINALSNVLGAISLISIIRLVKNALRDA